ncbi:permease-like cell division protein FtsX [Candidatus Poribacteria bacterium]|nr:permease-like cell division protein FtsX [Candidatus Poribacteria bacterium]
MRYKIENALRHFKYAGLTNFLCLIALAFFILILTTFLFNNSSVYKELENKESTPPLLAFLNDTVVEDDARLFANQIQKNHKILYIHYISKQENFKRYEKQFGRLGRWIKDSFSGSNPFPASLEIYVEPSGVSRTSLEKIAYEIESYDKVDDVKLTGHGVISDIVRQTNRITIACIILSGLITLFVIRAAVLKTGRIRVTEIQLLNLIGATRGYLRTPFIIHGMFLGIFGNIIGVFSFYILYCIFTSQLGVLEFIPAYQILGVIVSGGFIGIISGILAQRKCLRLI